MKSNPFRWIARAASWFRGGRPLPPSTVKAAADAVCRQANADIGVLVTRLTSGEITVADLEPLMQNAIKRGIIANTALAHGGYDNLTPKIIERAEAQVLAQHDFLRNRLEKVASNVRASGELTARDGHDLMSYSNAFRSVYENEFAQAKRDAGFTEAQRVLAAVSHCASCEEIAAQGWMPIDEMPPIGSDDCLNNCHCTLIFR